MCGRYRLSRRDQAFAKHFDAEYDGMEWQPRYNIAPTQMVPVIRHVASGPVRRSSLMKWGLVPSWAEDPAIGARMINARSETASSKPAFRDAMQSRRCLIPADGFYEWQRTGDRKQPYCFEMHSGDPFAFAGLWERWRAPSGALLETCTILTTTANALLADVHDRMPVILAPESYSIWLDPGIQDIVSASRCLKPCDAQEMRRYAVSTLVNNVVNDEPRCASPIESSVSIQAGLF